MISLWHHCDLVCICSGFVRGREGESPSLIAFKTNYTEGALLATVSGCQIHIVIGYCCLWLGKGRHIWFIAALLFPVQVWSGSRISFTPLSFQASASLSPFSYPEQLAATYTDAAKFQQQQPHLSNYAHSGSGRSTPLQSLSRTRLREHVATPLYSTQTAS